MTHTKHIVAGLLAGVLAALLTAPQPLVASWSLGGGDIASGTTPIVGGATTQVCYNAAGTLKCGDPGFTYNETTDVATIGAVRASDGSATAVAFGFSGAGGADDGMWRASDNAYRFAANGIDSFAIQSDLVALASTQRFVWAVGALGTAADLFLARDAAAVLQLGDDAATATNQAVGAHDISAGTLNVAGPAFTLQGGQGTGTGAGGSIMLATAPAGASGTAVNALVNQWQIDSAGSLLASTDNVDNIGAVASGRPATIFVGTEIESPLFDLTVSQTYAASNVTTDRTYDANATSIDELADVLGSLIADLRAGGLVD